MSKNKSQRMLNEISKKLKSTIKKYNEISIDNDLSLQKSNDIDGASRVKEEDVIKSVPYPQVGSSSEAIDSKANNFLEQINTIINNLNTFERNIENDFSDLENFVENQIEKELNNYKI